MRYVNDYDIAHARQTYTRNALPNRLGAALVVQNLAEWADDHSDGWAYWPSPVRAAARLIALIDPITQDDREKFREVDATDEELSAALRPVKSFLTRHGASPEDRERILRSGQPIDA